MKAKLDLITGFLGAGKTTFIKGYLNYLSATGEKVAIIENEFGKPGCDTALLKDTNTDVVELAGGCICCGQKVKFHDLIIQLSLHYNRIIVEPSGIYTLEDFFEVYQSPPVLARVEIGSILTILDLNQIHNLSPSSKNIMISQLSRAGCIIVSKLDNQSDEDRIRKVTKEFFHDLLINNKNISSHMMEERLCIKPWNMFTDLDYRRFQKSGYMDTNTSLPKENHQYVYQIFTIHPSFSSKGELSEFLNYLFSADCGNVLRLKGLARIEEESYIVNATPDSYTCSLYTNKDKTLSGLTIIGYKIRRKVIQSFFKS